MPAAVTKKMIKVRRHPAALLCDPSLKREKWEDFKKVFFRYREEADPLHFFPHITIKDQ